MDNIIYWKRRLIWSAFSFEPSVAYSMGLKRLHFPRYFIQVYWSWIYRFTYSAFVLGSTYVCQNSSCIHERDVINIENKDALKLN